MQQYVKHGVVVCGMFVAGAALGMEDDLPLPVHLSTKVIKVDLTAVIQGVDAINENLAQMLAISDMRPYVKAANYCLMMNAYIREQRKTLNQLEQEIAQQAKYAEKPAQEPSAKQARKLRFKFW